MPKKGQKQTSKQKEAARLANTVHGMRYTRIYSIWCEMKKRCYNKKHKDFKLYGGKGITVCNGWHAFKGFFSDMMWTYFEGASIERKDNEKGYFRENCKWIPFKDQARNTSSNKLSFEMVNVVKSLYLAGKTQVSIAKSIGCHKSTIYKAINNKSWNHEQI